MARPHSTRRTPCARAPARTACGRSHSVTSTRPAPTRDGAAIRDYVHVSELGDAHVAALRVLPRDTRGDPMNPGTGQGSSVREVIVAVAWATERAVPHIVVTRRAGGPAEVVAAPAQAQAQRTLNWTPRRGSIYEIVRAAVRWHARAQ